MPRTDPLCANCGCERESHRDEYINADGALVRSRQFGKCREIKQRAVDKGLQMCPCRKYKSPSLREKKAAHRRGAQAEDRVAAIVGGRRQYASGQAGDVRSAEAVWEVKSRSCAWLDAAYGEALVAARGTGLEPRVAIVTERGVYDVRRIS